MVLCGVIQRIVGRTDNILFCKDGSMVTRVDFVVEETLKRSGYGNMDITTKVCSMDEMIYSKRGKFKLIVNNLQQK